MISKLTFAAVVLLACFLGVTSQSPSCEKGQEGEWRKNTDLCSPEYEVCRSLRWMKSKCVVGFFKNATGRCERWDSETGCNIMSDNNKFFPTNGRRKRDLSYFTEVGHREKRQATICPSEKQYWCPSNVNEVIVYQVFDDDNRCQDYMVCLGGELKQYKCSEKEGSVYIYYNTRLQSCEQYPAISNICIWNSFASYTPYVGNKI